MALFGTDMIDVTTPDGRRMKLPQQLAAQFPGLQPVPMGAPAPVPVELPPAPDIGPIAPGDFAPPSAAAPAPGPQPAPVPQPSPAPAPAPAPLTNADLAKQGNAGAYNQQAAAVEQQAQAQRKLADVDAATATQIGDAMAAREERDQALLEERNKVAQENLAKHQTAMVDYDTKVKEIANTKIDRSVDHPVLAAISVALAGIGAALAGKPGENPALEALYRAIDRKVAGQQQDLEAKRSALATRKDQLGMERGLGRERIEDIDARRAAYIEQAAREIEKIKAKSGNDRVRANADVALADLGGKLAGLRGEYSQREEAKIRAEQDRKDRLQEQRAGRALGWAQLVENRRQFDIREENDLKAAAMAAAAKGGKKGSEDWNKQVKETEERGVSNAITGDQLLTPEGERMVGQAKDLEASAAKFHAQAETEQDPGKKQALAQRAAAEAHKASELRGEANVVHAWRTSGPDASKLRNLVASSQTIGTVNDIINDLRDKHGPNWLITEDGEAMMQTYGVQLTMALKDAWKLGVLSAQDVELLNNASGGDPTGLTPGDIAKWLGTEGVAARLSSLTKGTEAATLNQLRSHGYKGGYRIARANPAEADQQGEAALKSKTPLEGVARAAPSSAIDKIKDKLNPANTANALYGGEEDAQRRRELAAEGTQTAAPQYPGLNDEQASYVDSTLKAYRRDAGSKDPKARARAEEAADKLVGMATYAARPYLASATLQALETEAPDLYATAVKKLPPAAKAALEENRGSVLATTPARVLLENGDEASRREVARRIGAGDKEAMKAVAERTKGRAN